VLLIPVRRRQPFCVADTSAEEAALLCCWYQCGGGSPSVFQDVEHRQAGSDMSLGALDHGCAGQHTASLFDDS
jgi:hypothetical protein